MFANNQRGLNQQFTRHNVILNKQLQRLVELKMRVIKNRDKLSVQSGSHDVAK